jgi:hypothetical protein
MSAAAVISLTGKAGDQPAWVAYFVAFILIVLLIVQTAREGFSGDQPFDYGGTQRRDVLLSHTGSDGRTLAEKINDALEKHGPVAVAKAVEQTGQKEGLVATTNGAPAFWEGSLYNLEGKMKGGAIVSDRSGQGGEGFRERLDDSALLNEGFDDSKMENFDDADLLKQNFRGSRW